MESLPDSGVPYAVVTFSGTGGAAKGKRLVLRAFWDGGREWKVRFAAPVSGEWSYASQSGDPGLNGVSGTLSCAEWTEAEKNANPTRRGMLRVAASGPRAGRYFTYDDGTPFLWVGDTWWNWSKPGIKFESFKKLVDDRAEKGFTVAQLRFNSDAMLDASGTKVNLEEIRRVEQFIAYANSRGITVWAQAWWGGKNLKPVGPEKVRRWWRYTMQRLGAYPVFWVLAGEYNMGDYGGLGLPFWMDLAAMIRREDPWGRMISAHPTPPCWGEGYAAPQWSTAEIPELQPLFDFNQSQVGHGRYNNEMIPSVVSAAYASPPAKPIVVTEPWYEFVEGSASAADVRYGAWSAVLSGAAGHSYGGGHVWWAHVPESPVDEKFWPLDKSFDKNTLDYPGARSMGVFAHLLRSMDWWKLEPHPELLTETPSKFCAAVPGLEYLVYLRWAGMTKLDLRPSTSSDQFDFEWIDPATGNISGKGSVPGGAVQRFEAPGGFPAQLQPADWVLRVKKKDKG